jgi:hypothetical protein
MGVAMDSEKSSGTMNICDGAVEPEAKAHDDISEKTAQIRAACRQRDVSSIVRLAISAEGLINDDLRRAACTSPHIIVTSVTYSFQGRYYSVATRKATARFPPGELFPLTETRSKLPKT